MNLVPKLIIFLCTFIGASTIVVAEPMLQLVPPVLLLAIRFILAAMMIAFFLPKKVFPISKESLRMGIVTGFGFGAGCLLLYYAIPHVRAGKVTFLVALEVLIVPLICQIIYKQKLSTVEKIAIFPVVFGLWLITGGDNTSFSIWEVLALLSAFAYAIYTISLSHSANTANVYSRTFIAFLFIGICALCFSLFIEPIREINFSYKITAGLLYLVVVGSFARFLMQAWAQRFVSAPFTALTFSAEPVFAIFMSYIFLGERLTVYQTCGAVLILSGIVVANVSSATSQR
jgi:drug/metabolite transporter (DMT)-like permease